MAQELSHPYSLAYALVLGGHGLAVAPRRCWPCRSRPRPLIALATAQGFPHWAAHGTILRGWALAMQDQGEVGLAQVRQGLAAWRATGASADRPILVHRAGGSSGTSWASPEDGLQALAEAHDPGGAA